VEPQVVEVHGEGLEAWHAAHGQQLAVRHEMVGETGFYYARDPGPLLAALDPSRAMARNLRFLHRRGNLEDVFVRLTGRELRDA
jgi:lipooligosaccharide transport system ATP-binding protein